MIFVSHGEPGFNTTAPTGELADSGWQLQGQWNGFLGTPIAPNLFLTAKHVGGAPGDIFRFQGVDYQTLERYADPDSDLQIWRICGEFPVVAPLYPRGDESGKPLVVFGRGLGRGTEIAVAGLPQPEAKGWRWDTAGGALRWGENQVSQVVNGAGLPDLGTSGELLAVEFNFNAGENEAHLASGDSGGAVFIRDDGVWKLAGINYAVDGPFNFDDDPEDMGFHAALHDTGGLYRKVNDSWTLTPDTPVDVPSRFYATRVSSRQAWINGIIDTWSTVQPPPTLTAALSLSDAFEPVDGAVPENNTYAIPLGDETRFYRLEGCLPSRIVNLSLTDDSLTIQFEFVD